jgi:hypothetical protein
MKHLPPKAGPMWGADMGGHCTILLQTKQIYASGIADAPPLMMQNAHQQDIPLDKSNHQKPAIPKVHSHLHRINLNNLEGTNKFYRVDVRSAMGFARRTSV